jgi:hypothetical protein
MLIIQYHKNAEDSIPSDKPTKEEQIILDADNEDEDFISQEELLGKLNISPVDIS